MKKIIIISIVILVFIFGIILFFYFKNKNNKIIKTFGNIEIRTVDLSFQVQGLIKEVFREEGDYVKEGELLALLDDRDYSANYKRALEEEKSALAQMREDLSKYKRNLPLCSDNSISKQDCTTLLNTKDLSSARYETTKANTIYQKNQLDYTKLYSPQNGIITTRAQEKGARVGAGQIVYVLSLHKPVWVRTYINEKDLGNIKYGMKARVLSDTIDPKTNKKREYKGFIGYISPVAEFTPKTVQTEDLRVDLVYRVRIYIYDIDEFLRQGMPVTVVIEKEQNNDKLHS